MSFLKAQVSFLSNVASIFSVIKQNFPILFLAQTLYTLFKRSPLKSKFLRFSSAQVKTHQVPHVNFELTSQFIFNFCIIMYCHDTQFPCTFQAHTFSTSDKSIPSRSQFGDFQVLWSKFANFLMSIFGNTSQFFFRICIRLECNRSQLLCTFLAQTLYNLVKSSPLKCKCLRLWSSRVKIRQIVYVNFERTSQFLFRFSIVFQSHYL